MLTIRVTISDLKSNNVIKNDMIAVMNDFKRQFHCFCLYKFILFNDDDHP